MKKILFLCLGILVVALLPFIIQACAAPDQTELTKLREQNKLLKDLAGPLPASLDNFFPPKAPAPVWLFEMFAMEGAAAGIMGDLQQGDMVGVKTSFQAFKAQYQKISGMVPEWKDFFPMKPIDDLGAAIDGGDPAKIGAAFGPVGAVCENCHIRNMVKAHQKYHWPSFEAVKVANPLGGPALGWKDYMFQMAGTFMGIGNDLRQGQVENARKSFQAFSATFKGLSEGCKACHATPRTYFVDASVQAMVDELGKVLAADKPDAKKVEELSGAIGNESCMKCHLVHLPAANTKARWEKFADALK